MGSKPVSKGKRILKSFLAGMIMVALLAVLLPEVTSYSDKISELEAKIKAAKEERRRMQDVIEENKDVLVTLNSTADTLRETLDSLNIELKTVSNNLDEIESKIDSKNQEIKEIEFELAEANALEEEQYELMKKHIKHMYESGGYKPVDSLVGAVSFSDLLNRSYYFEELSDYDHKMILRYAKTCRLIEDAKELLVDEMDDLEKLFEKSKEEQDRVSSLVDRTTVAIEKYQDEIEETEKEMLLQEKALIEQLSSITTLQTQLEEEKRLSQLAKASTWRDVSQLGYTEGDRKLLANIIYCEAGNQSFEGQLAVGAVVINRVESSVFPDTIVGVIYQNNQFSPVKSGRLALALANDSATETCYQAADAAMAGQSNVGNCLFFRTQIPGLNGIFLGDHVFY